MHRVIRCFFLLFQFSKKAKYQSKQEKPWKPIKSWYNMLTEDLHNTEIMWDEFGEIAGDWLLQEDVSTM